MKVNQLFSIIFFLLFSPFFLSAQTVVEGIEELNRKQSGNALTVTIEGQVENVEKVMEQLFESGSGEKVRKKSGAYQVEGARLGEISGKTLDYYYTVEKPNRGDKIHSKVSLFISTGNNNFVNSEEFPRVMESAEEMLQGLQLLVRIYEMELLIEEQEKMIGKEEKQYERLQEDSVKLEEIILNTEAQLQENKAEQADQRSRISTERDRLQAFLLQLDQLRNERDNPAGQVEDRELMDALEEEFDSDGN